ncbi:MAG: hypothetical protein RLZZ175_1952 [Bacteroidota bacterium]|jgi:hypothetical protein
MLYLLEKIFRFLTLSILELRALKSYLVFLLIITLIYTAYTSIGRNMLFTDTVTVWEPGDEKDAQTGKERFEHK